MWRKCTLFMIAIIFLMEATACQENHKDFSDSNAR